MEGILEWQLYMPKPESWTWIEVLWLLDVHNFPVLVYS